MVTINGTTYYKPREIAEQSLIVNSKGKADYGYVLRLVKTGKLKAKIFNEDSQIPYYLVPASEVQKYNNKFTAI